jgi:spermidine synthase
MISIIKKYVQKLTLNRLKFYIRRSMNPTRTIYEHESPISGRIKVVDIGRERQLRINGETHSVIFLKGSWKELEREYWGKIVKPPFRFPANPTVLLCGLGGGTTLRFLQTIIKPFSITVIERDLDVLNIAKQYFFIDDIPVTRMLKGDAMEVMKGLAHAGEKFDYIIDDIYFEKEHLNLDFIKKLIQTFSSLLSKSGVIALNRALDDGTDIDRIYEQITVMSDSGFKIKRSSIKQRWRNEILYGRFDN